MLPLHDSNGDQFGHLTGDACVVDHLDYLADILVRIRFFLCKT